MASGERYAYNPGWFIEMRVPAMCGLFGVVNARKAAELTVIGLHGIQHRAVDYAGIVSTDGRYFYRERGEGVVRDVFTGEMLDLP